MQLIKYDMMLLQSLKLTPYFFCTIWRGLLITPIDQSILLSGVVHKLRDRFYATFGPPPPGDRAWYSDDPPLPPAGHVALLV